MVTPASTDSLLLLGFLESGLPHLG